LRNPAESERKGGKREVSRRAMVVGAKGLGEEKPDLFSLKITGLLGEITKRDNRENRMPVNVKDAEKIGLTKRGVGGQIA